MYLFLLFIIVVARAFVSVKYSHTTTFLSMYVDIGQLGMYDTTRRSQMGGHWASSVMATQQLVFPETVGENWEVRTTRELHGQLLFCRNALHVKDLTLVIVESLIKWKSMWVPNGLIAYIWIATKMRSPRLMPTIKSDVVRSSSLVWSKWLEI